MGPTLIAVYRAAKPLEQEHGYVTPPMLARALPDREERSIKNALQKLRKAGLLSRAHAASVERDRKLAAVLEAVRAILARGGTPGPKGVAAETGFSRDACVKYLSLLRDDGEIDYVNAPGQGQRSDAEEEARIVAAYDEIREATGRTPGVKAVAKAVGRHVERVRRRMVGLRDRGLIGEYTCRRGPAKGTATPEPEREGPRMEKRLKALRERTGERGYWKSQGELFAFLDELDRRGLNAC